MLKTLAGSPEQAAFYPGAIYLFSCWYTRKVCSESQPITGPNNTPYQELAFRSAILYGALTLSNAFGSVSISLMLMDFC